MGATKYNSKELQQNIWEDVIKNNDNSDNTLNLHIVNHNTMPARVNIALVDSLLLNDIENKHVIVLNHTIPALSYDFWRGIVVSPGCTLAVLSDIDGVTFNAYGFKEIN